MSCQERNPIPFLPALLCAAAALVWPASARADLPLEVKLYGFLNAEVEWVRALGGTTPYTSRMRLSDGNSRLGLTGSYDVTPDLKAVVQLEGALNAFEQGGIDDTGHTFSIESRNSFVGVDDRRFGRLILGNQDSAYRSLVGTGNEFGGNWGLTAQGLDLWNNTTAAMSGGYTSLFGRGESRLKNSIHYFSPELFGVRVAGSYGFDEAATIGGRRDHASLGALFKWEGLRVGVGWDYQANTGVNTDSLLLGLGMSTGAANDVSTNFYKVIVSYLFRTGTYVGAGYERSVYGYAAFVPPVPGQIYTPLGQGTQSQGGFMISAAQSLGALLEPLDGLTAMASWGKLGNLSDSIYGSGADYGATQLSAGLKYALGPSFMVYGFFTRIDNKPLQTLNLGTPVFSNANGTSDAFLAPGNKPTAGGAGLIARF